PYARSLLPCLKKPLQGWSRYAGCWTGIFAMRPMPDSSTAAHRSDNSALQRGPASPAVPPGAAEQGPAAGRLTLFIPSLNGGGAERVMVSLANGLSAKGLDVDLVLAREAGVYLTEVSRDVRIVDLGVRRTLEALWPL